MKALAALPTRALVVLAPLARLAAFVATTVASAEAIRGGEPPALAASFDYAMPARFGVPALPDQDAPAAAATFYFRGAVRELKLIRLYG